MEIKLTPKESEEYFHNAMCNGLEYMSGYGLEFDYSQDEYNSAKSKLKSPCFEDVLSQILKDGGILRIIDNEGDGEYTRTITIKDVHERVQKTPLSHLTDMIKENNDVVTADVILQTVFFEGIIFG